MALAPGEHIGKGVALVKALITGDRGFLGRHFTAELRRRGWEVYGLDTKASSSQDCRRFFQHDEINRRGWDTRSSFDFVVHCAAVVGGRETIENSPLDTAASLSIDAEMFRWAAIVKPGRVLYISSSAAYNTDLQTADGPRLPLREDWLSQEPGKYTLKPDRVYGWTKVTGEYLADDLRRAGVPVTVVRPFSGYGSDQDPAYPFRAILDRVKAGDDPLEVWCGDCVRDWIHVDDLVAGALAVAESGTEEPVNLCTGRPTSFTDMARLMASVAGYEPEIRSRSDKPQGVAYRVGDPFRMLAYYTPVVSLEQGIVRTLGSGQESR